MSVPHSHAASALRVWIADVAELRKWKHRSVEGFVQRDISFFGAPQASMPRAALIPRQLSHQRAPSSIIVLSEN